MSKWSICQEDKTIINIYAPNSKLKYKQKQKDKDEL